MKSLTRFSLRTKVLAAAIGLALSAGATAQLIYGNSFPYWTVRGPLTVTGVSTLSGGQVLTGTTTIGAGATLTSPAITTSITTGSTSFTALAGATTLLTLGGTGASASVFAPSTLDTTSSITGAIRTSGGISAAKAANFGTTLAVGTTSTLTGLVTVPAGIKGTTTNDAATALNVGELLTATVAAGSPVAGDTSTTAKNLTSVSLTAGDWDVSGTCDFLGSTLIATVLSCGLGTTTNTQASQAGGAGIGTDPLTIESFASQTIPDSVRAIVIPPTRVTLASTTTIYMVAKNTFSSGTYSMYGTIRARRMR